MQGQEIGVVLGALDFELGILLDLEGKIVLGAVADVALKKIVCEESHKGRSKWWRKVRVLTVLNRGVFNENTNLDLRLYLNKYNVIFIICNTFQCF